MLTEEQFYKEKIFLKKGKNSLCEEYPKQKDDINQWYMSDRYNYIQERKSFLSEKLKKAQELENEDFTITDRFLYKFFLWFEQTPKICIYCGLEEEQLEALHSMPGHINKRYPQRGKSLEIDRKKPDRPYSDIDNLVFACYWCNNAKTDTFTDDEFKEVGIEIRKIWAKRLGKQ